MRTGETVTIQTKPSRQLWLVLWPVRIVFYMWNWIIIDIVVNDWRWISLIRVKQLRDTKKDLIDLTSCQPCTNKRSRERSAIDVKVRTYPFSMGVAWKQCLHSSRPTEIMWYKARVRVRDKTNNIRRMILYHLIQTDFGGNFFTISQNDSSGVLLFIQGQQRKSVEPRDKILHTFLLNECPSKSWYLLLSGLYCHRRNTSEGSR